MEHAWTRSTINSYTWIAIWYGNLPSKGHRYAFSNFVTLRWLSNTFCTSSIHWNSSLFEFFFGALFLSFLGFETSQTGMWGGSVWCAHSPHLEEGLAVALGCRQVWVQVVRNTYCFTSTCMFLLSWFATQIPKLISFSLGSWVVTAWTCCGAGLLAMRGWLNQWES